MNRARWRYAVTSIPVMALALTACGGSGGGSHAASDGTRFIIGHPRGGSGPQTRINIVVGWMSDITGTPDGAKDK